MEDKKRLILFTLGLGLFLFSGAATYELLRAPTPVVVKDAGFPTLGKLAAPVEIVLIEDFQCRSCRAFTRNILPKIQSEYVRSGKARFILVPVAFLSGPQILANASLEIYEQYPAHFFTFLKEVLAQENEIKKEDLLRVAQRLSHVDLEKFQSSMDVGAHNKQLEENLNWAQRITGSQFKTPTLFVNGEPASTFSFEAVKYQIDKILEKK